MLLVSLVEKRQEKGYMKKTALYKKHVDSGGKMVDFAGFMMPVSYTGIVNEHETVREKVGLFDVSHMGEIEITGDRALEFADYAVTNSVEALDNGRICYTVCCRNDGGILDDLLAYRFSSDRILLVANAANYQKIYRHLSGIAWDDIEVTDRSAGIGQIAVQGPLSLDLLLRSDLCTPVRDQLEELDYYHFFTLLNDGEEVIISRTGYTGEKGYEVYMPEGQIIRAWEDFMEKGKEMEALPAGLGARDTLRFEAGYCLYGHEIDEETSPLEARLSWVVKLDKEDFVGKEALVEQKKNKPERKLIGLEMTDKGIPRQGFDIYTGGEKVGRITSGTFSPTLRKPLAMALIKRSVSRKIKDFEIDVRGKMKNAKRIKLPFYPGRVKD
ncbi:MAG: glycine cleavage system aminomethyltransferase GcvT [Candidatus Latescibacteria bacterium]|nr:glycine cleavage system aminomethyltransferase GcvT [bacterium]MBD3424409.1 glycine cleavage system aminomethyltransferase GcvT [Candidatus Latescibacterota bacterium]